MTSRRFTAAIATGMVASLTLGVGQAWAHHAFAAEFDAKAPVLLRGTVTKMEWINPHTWIHIIVRNSDGTTTPWMVEGGTPNTLLRAGADRNSLKPGTDIVVRGFQSKDRVCTPVCKANGRDVTFADGRKIFMGSSNTGAPIDGADPAK